MDNSPVVYLDHAATTPMLPEAIAAMTEELAQLGNPSSLHNAGRRARRVVEESREQLAEVFGARASEVIFTSGGTEADNLAVKGLYWARRATDERRNRILTTAVEHHAVFDSVRWLCDAHGARADWLAVDSLGLVSADVLRAALDASQDSAAVVSVMWANNEVGAVQPVASLAAAAREYGVPFHTDAVQAAAQLPVDFAGSGADVMTVTAHKLGGPVGVGALILAKSLAPVPVLHGGGQERDIRSGTLDAPAIRAFAVAAVASAERRSLETKRIAALRDDLIRQVTLAVPDALLNGPPPGPDRLPGNAHFSFPGCEGDALLLLLDARGIACSTGSACTAGVAEPSHVLLAMGADEDRARGSLRFSLGHTTTQADVDALGAAIGDTVTRARRAAASTGLLARCSTGPESFWSDVPPAQLYWSDVPQAHNLLGLASPRNWPGPDNLKELWGFGYLPPCRAAWTPPPRRLARPTPVMR
jgi:cysteine desulfurase